VPTQIALELCGVGAVSIRLPAKASDRDSAGVLPRHLFDLASAQAWPRVVSALESSPTDRSRAAALVLRAAGLPEPNPAMSPAPQPADGLRYVGELAELGRSTRDPGVLQWALAVCARVPELPQCQAISPADLVALQPEDGWHWLRLGAADKARRDEALVQASQARYFGTEPSLAAAVEAAAPADLLPYLRQKLLIDAIGVQAALPGPVGGHWWFTACAKAASNNTATCLALADTLYMHGHDLRSLGWALGVGKRMGWSSERVKAVQAEQASLYAQIPRFDTWEMFSCTSVDRMRSWTLEQAEVGERVGLQRRAAAASSAPLPPTR
jgi:hypothetical protein